MVFIKPPKWTMTEFAEASQRARDMFSSRRRTEGLTFYLDAFDGVETRVAALMGRTSNLQNFRQEAFGLLTDDYIREVRYLSSPVISEDDLKTLCEITTLSKTALRRNPDGAARIKDLIWENIDPKRFPWLRENRNPTPEEKKTALVATTIMMASQETQTNRRKLAQERQEGGVASFLVSKGFHEVARRPIMTAADAPRRNEFCRESPVGGKKADIVIGLADGRFVALECKVSNSEVNSFKRLNHETVEKVTYWHNAFGSNGVVGAAVLDGVFKVSNLLAAQDEGVSIFWSFDLSPLGDFLQQVAEESR